MNIEYVMVLIAVVTLNILRPKCLSRSTRRVGRVWSVGAGYAVLYRCEYHKETALCTGYPFSSEIVFILYRSVDGRLALLAPLACVNRAHNGGRRFGQRAQSAVLATQFGDLYAQFCHFGRLCFPLLLQRLQYFEN